MTGPAREDLEQPGKKDAWDDEEGVPVDVEDIAIVCHEALRAYRTTQGSGSGWAWMHQTTNERKQAVERVSAILEDKPGTLYDDDTETKLVVSIVRALAP